MTFFHASPEVINQLLCFLETYLSKAITNLYQSAKRENPARMHKAKVVKVVIPLSPFLLLLPEDMIPLTPIQPLRIRLGRLLATSKSSVETLLIDCEMNSPNQGSIDGDIPSQGYQYAKPSQHKSSILRVLFPRTREDIFALISVYFCRAIVSS